MGDDFFVKAAKELAAKGSLQMQQWGKQPVPVVEPPDYDMAGYIAKYGQPDQSKGQHLTDEFKLPNHITFSKDSIYSTPETPGGEWKQGADGGWNYYASPYVVQQHGVERLLEYFRKHEPDATLHLPEAYKGKK